MAKFSKKMGSIIFLLAALFIALLLGSFSFLVIQQPANLPHFYEGMKPKHSPAPAPKSKPPSKKSPSKQGFTNASPPSAAASSNIDIDKLVESTMKK